jgi:hypothetical protein
MPIYKVSYVVTGSDHPGAILNRQNRPKVGEKILLGSNMFEIIEVLDLLPPRGEFHYIHVTCSLLDKNPAEIK